MDICIRCGRSPASEFEDYCFPCGTKTRRELARGLRRLERYLGAWRAFDEWLDQRDGCAGSGSLNDRPRGHSQVRRAAGHLPTGYSILSGAVAGGSLAGLHGRGEQLAIVACTSGDRYVAELVAYVSIGVAEAAALRGLAVEVRREVPAPGIGLALSLYNWRTKCWQRLETVCPDRAGDTLLARLPRRSTCDFVSPTGDLCLGIRAEHSRAFRTRTGLVRFIVGA